MHLRNVIKVISVAIIVESLVKVDAEYSPNEYEEYGDYCNVDDPFERIREAL